MYNVLAKLRVGEPLTDKDKRIREQGLVSVLRQIHDDLDAAVAAAYGWPADLPDDELLRRLVALNAERADEERRGIVRWLRPAFQNPGGQAAVQADLGLAADDPAAAGGPAGKGKKAAGAAARKPAWPKELAEPLRLLRAALVGRPAPAPRASWPGRSAGPRSRGWPNCSACWPPSGKPGRSMAGGTRRDRARGPAGRADDGRGFPAVAAGTSGLATLARGVALPLRRYAGAGWGGGRPAGDDGRRREPGG